jgi:hypothetical protein
VGPASVYALCDVQDGNYVLVDVVRSRCGGVHSHRINSWCSPDVASAEKAPRFQAAQ